MRTPALRRLFLVPVLVWAVPFAGCGEGPSLPTGTGPEAVARSEARAEVTAATFRGGFGQRDITPTRRLILGGYGTYTLFGTPPRRNQGGAHDPLLATAMAVRSEAGPPLVLLAVDAVGLSSESVKRIRSRVGDGVAVVVTSSHSHSTPDTLGLWGPLPLSGRDGRYLEELETKAAEAAREALARLAPVTLRLATGRVANTSTGTSAEEDAFTTLAAYDAGGSVVGTFTQWAGHPTMLGPKNEAYSADFVGAFRKYVEGALPNAPHAYANGALGGVYPRDETPPRPDPFTGGTRDPDALAEYDQMAGVGGSLADAVLAALPTAPWLTVPIVAFRHADVAIAIDNWRFRVARQAGVIETRLDAPREVDWFQIGEVQGATVPGEMFPGSMTRVRSLLTARGAAATMPIGMGNEWLGYLMSPEEYDDPDLSYFRDLSPSRDASVRLENALRDLVAAP